MFTSVSAAVSADPLANLLAASVLLVLVRQVRRPVRGSGWAIGTGVLIGMGLLTKLALGIFVPLALLVVVMRSRHRTRDSALCVGAMGVVVSPWLVHQVTTYGWADPLATTRHAQVVLDQERFPGFSLTYLGEFLTISFHSFWAQFGWMAIVAPDRLYWLWGVLVLVALVGLLRDSRQLRESAWRLILGSLAAAFLAYLAYNLEFIQFQGRYLFTAIVPIALLLVLGWSAWLPARFQGWGVVLVALGLVSVNAYALLRVLVLGFAPTG
jgi:4-amino-4-deoxy-L-arabinose transferase-like glycosyltransferase